MTTHGLVAANELVTVLTMVSFHSSVQEMPTRTTKSSPVKDGIARSSCLVWALKSWITR